MYCIRANMYVFTSDLFLTFLYSSSSLYPAIWNLHASSASGLHSLARVILVGFGLAISESSQNYKQ